MKNARICKRCGRELGDDEIVCRACEGEKAQILSLLKEEPKNIETTNEIEIHGYDTQEGHTRRSKDKIAPKSLNGLSSLSFLFRLVDVFFTLLGVIVGYIYYRSTEDVLVSLMIGIIIISLGFFYMMISTMFQALHDIVRGLYYIANK